MYDSTKRVSYFDPPITNTTPKKLVSLSEVYQVIIGESVPGLEGITQGLRNLEDPKGRKSYKETKFPFVVFSGEFSKRAKDGLERNSDLFILDFDHIGTPEEVEELKKKVSEDKELDPVLLFRSPSGDGLKVVVNIGQEIKSDEEFKRAFKSLDNYTKTKYSLSLDQSGKDISRGCLLPYDPDAILLDSGSGFNVVKWTPQEQPKRNPVPVDFTDDYTRARIAVEDIERSGIDITGSYDLWRRVGFALSTLGEPGRDLFHRVSVSYPDYNRQETDRMFSSLLNSSGDGVHLESLFAIAKEKGVHLRSSRFDEGFTFPRHYYGPIPPPMEEPEEENEDRSFLLQPTSESEIFDRESSLPEGLKTGYCIGYGDEKSQIILGSGVLTGVVGATGHRKSVFLLNLLLNVAKKYPEKRFILFTYEEKSDRVIEYLLNIYLNDLDLKKGESNRRVLKEYFRTRGGNLSSFDRSSVEEFKRRKGLFFRNYIDSGRILIKLVDSDSVRLSKDIKYLSEQGNIGGVFVDYFQCINVPSDKGFRLTRVEELKRICFQLKDVATDTGLPVVLACQFNQAVCSPTDVLVTNVGEAGDISRIMSEMFGLWSMDKEIGRDLKNDSDKKKVELLRSDVDRIKEERGVALDSFTYTGLYIKTLKSRELPTGTEAVLPVFGKTGKVYPNDDDKNPDMKVFFSNDWEEEKQQTFDFPE